MLLNSHILAYVMCFAWKVCGVVRSTWGTSLGEDKLGARDKILNTKVVCRACAGCALGKHSPNELIMLVISQPDVMAYGWACFPRSVAVPPTSSQVQMSGSAAWVGTAQQSPSHTHIVHRTPCLYDGVSCLWGVPLQCHVYVSPGHAFRPCHAV